MSRQALLAVGLGAIVLLLGAASAPAEPGGEAGVAGARAYAVEVIVPGQEPYVAGAAEAPPDATGGGAASYPSEGSAVTVASSGATASAKPGASPVASASLDIGRISIFNGEITADSVNVRAETSAAPEGASGDFGDSKVSGLLVFSQPVASAQTEVKLGDWGRLLVLSQATDVAGAPNPGYRGTLVGLEVRVDSDHGGLPAGSRIIVGYAEVWGTAAAAPAVTVPPTTTTTETAPLAPPVATTTPRTKRTAPSRSKPSAPLPALPRPTRGADERLQPPEPDRLDNGRPSPFRSPPSNLTPKLTAGGYVFPVYGPFAYTDTFGAPRADVSYHHGDDIFAPLGAPVLAVANGTVFSVGWNDIGGNRLWLRDDQGNQFYYAHLSAFSTLAVNGRRVKAGDVLGFVGATGDAVGTPAHLHFEIHPVDLLFLGYDGAVNPTQYLDAWRRLDDIVIRAAVGRGPAFAPLAHAPVPGAILLQSSDISTASGLNPDSLRKALAPSGWDGAVSPLVDLGRG